jgi:hypothetical protein
VFQTGSLFWDVMPYSLVRVQHYFTELYYCHYQDQGVSQASNQQEMMANRALKMEAFIPLKHQ